MDWRDYVDISSCMLFETTGDSEADFDITVNMGASSEDTAGLAEDDAFSCSCENEYYQDFDHRTEDHVYADDEEEEEEKLVDDEYHEEEEVDEGEDNGETVDQVRNDHQCKAGVKVVLKRNSTHQKSEEGEVVMEEQQRKKMKVCGAELMNERDKDRLFWESCLAS